MDLSNLIFRTFSHATEDEGKVDKAVIFVSGAEEVGSSRSLGFHGNPIIVIEARITDAKRMKAFFRSLDKSTIKTLLDTIEDRIDDDSFFFLRLDKQEAYKERFVLAKDEDVISVRGKIR